MNDAKIRVIPRANEKTRRSFGSGLEAVLNAANRGTDKVGEKTNQQELKRIMVHQLVPGEFQPRREFDQHALEELSESIAKQGILQPIIARQSKTNEYEIIAGERRWRAAQMAGLQQVPVIVCDISNESALAFGLIENIQRQDLNPVEEAMALKRLIEEFNMTHEQVAESVGRSRALVTNTLRLLNLTPSVQEHLISKKLDVGHVKVLLVFSPEEQEKLASTIIERRMSVRDAEKLAQKKKINTPGKIKNQTISGFEEEIFDLKENLLKKFPKTFVQCKPEGKGVRITFSFKALEDVNSFLMKLDGGQ